MKACGESDEDCVRTDALEEGALDDGAVFWDDFKGGRVGGGEAGWFALWFLEESEDGGDLRGATSVEQRNRGFFCGPERGHEGVGAVRGRVSEVIAQPCVLQAFSGVVQVDGLDSERGAVVPAVAGDAVHSAV